VLPGINDATLIVIGFVESALAPLEAGEPPFELLLHAATRLAAVTAAIAMPIRTDLIGHSFSRAPYGSPVRI
jgi:hypothetical protein